MEKESDSSDLGGHVWRRNPDCFWAVGVLHWSQSSWDFTLSLPALFLPEPPCPWSEDCGSGSAGLCSMLAFQRKTLYSHGIERKIQSSSLFPSCHDKDLIFSSLSAGMSREKGLALSLWLHHLSVQCSSSSLSDRFGLTFCSLGSPFYYLFFLSWLQRNCILCVFTSCFLPVSFWSCGISSMLVTFTLYLGSLEKQACPSIQCTARLLCLVWWLRGQLPGKDTNS